MIKSRFLLSCAALLAMFSLSAEAKLYKWVDNNGTTHYGETIPPEYANKKAVTLDNGRIGDREDKRSTSKKGDSENTGDLTEEQKAKIETKRKDNALLNTYSNEKEIDLARDRNLLQVEARVNSFTTLLKSAQDTLDGLHQESDGLVAKGRKIPQSLTEDLVEGEALVAKRKKDLDISQQEMDAVKARYEGDKKRYRELKGLAPQE